MYVINVIFLNTNRFLLKYIFCISLPFTDNSIDENNDDDMDDDDEDDSNTSSCVQSYVDGKTSIL